MIEQYKDSCSIPEYRALLTIQLGQLIQGGNFSWSDEPLASAMNGLIYYSYAEDDKKKLYPIAHRDDIERLQAMFDAKFYWREISITPPGQWRQMLLYKIKYELVPKYKPVYDALRAGDIDPLHSGDEYYKERIIRSDFPETELAASSEVYASSGDDREYQKLQTGDGQEILGRYYSSYINVDTAFMNELEIFFTDMYSLHNNLL